ncbi:MAG TPA: EAL domain-containing protein, partial [Streptosporangiaceae bacterium]|nr:EAL domain-containing protein [Streptosporangiaceae bacterium]
CVVQVRVGRDSQSLSLSEIPLVMGLFLAQPRELLAARLLGGALVFVLVRRQTARKAAFNTALNGAGAATALITFHLLLAGAAPLDGRGWLAAVTAAVITGVLDASALALVLGWHNGRPPTWHLLRMLLLAVVTPALVSLTGVVAVLAFSRGEAALPLAVTGAAALIGYRAFAILSRRHASLERLYELSDALAEAPETQDVIASVLRQSLDLLRVAYVEVVLADGEGGRLLRWTARLGRELRGPDEVPAVTLTPSGVTLLRGGTAQERAFLAIRGVSSALLVPLRVDQHVLGHLLVADRIGEGRGFNAADGRLLEIVANHGSVALRNGQLIDRLNFEARHDELTHLPNRLHFKELLEAAAAAAGRGGAGCAVMVLDFDGFKAINDTLGHQAGDDLLRVLADRLEATGGRDALVARLGGDEFAVLSTRCNEEAEAQALAARLLAVFDDPVEVAGTRLRLGGSLGIALGPEHGTTGSDLLRHADIAMYAAKSGAGGARMFTSDLMEGSAVTLTLASDLRDAVACDEIELAVQPVVELESGRVHSVEVLARWTHPELGEIAPEAFFAAAERSGQITVLSARILDRALGLCRGWHEQGIPLRVAVNLAPRWLADSSLPEQVGLALARHAVPADLLCLELTESSVIADPRRAVMTLSRLRDMGVRLSVDDFGTGYSSLTYLSRLPVHQMKIDKSFVLRLHESRRDRAIVRSIVDLGRNLGLEVVAEGVTEPGTRRALQEMGCVLGQGYLFSRPIDPADLPRLIAATGVVHPDLVPAALPGRGAGMVPPQVPA